MKVAQDRLTVEKNKCKRAIDDLNRRIKAAGLAIEARADTVNTRNKIKSDLLTSQENFKQLSNQYLEMKTEKEISEQKF
jgi:hypothetical protein